MKQEKVIKNTVNKSYLKLIITDNVEISHKIINKNYEWLMKGIESVICITPNTLIDLHQLNNIDIILIKNLHKFKDNKVSLVKFLLNKNKRVIVTTAITPLHNVYDLVPLSDEIIKLR